MTGQVSQSTRTWRPGGDEEPADSLVASAQPPALGLDGRWVSTAELEGAAELSRVARRLGLHGRGLNGFRLYKGYLAVLRAMDRVIRILPRARGVIGDRR